MVAVKAPFGHAPNCSKLCRIQDGRNASGPRPCLTFRRYVQPHAHLLLAVGCISQVRTVQYLCVVPCGRGRPRKSFLPTYQLLPNSRFSRSRGVRGVRGSGAGAGPSQLEGFPFRPIKSNNIAQFLLFAVQMFTSTSTTSLASSPATACAAATGGRLWPGLR